MVYEPHSDATRSAYEKFLKVVRRHAPPGIEDFIEFAETFLHDLRSTTTPKSVCKSHFGFDLGADAVHTLIECASQLNDFIKDSTELETFSSDSDGDSSDSSDTKSEVDVDLYDHVSNDDLSIDGDTQGDIISLTDVTANPHYLEEKLRNLFPDSTEINVNSVLEYLASKDTDSIVLESQLNSYLGAFDDEDASKWIRDVVDNRWAVVYGMKLSQSISAAERDRVVEEMKRHSESDKQVRSLYSTYTGVDLNVGDEGGSSEDDFFQLRPVDIKGLQFANEMSSFRSTRLVAMPRGTQFTTHLELLVNPPPPQHSAGEVKRVSVGEFPEWARLCFPQEVVSLNRMQSQVFPCAFGSDENMLVSAPTGAGKTNVALMAILRTLHNAINSRTGELNLSTIKVVYVAPMKALVQEMANTFAKRLAPLGVTVAELSGDASLSKSQLAETHVIVTTPEKWDVVTRKSMDLGVASMVRLIIIDEVHLLHNDRGPVLESILARFKLHQQQNTLHSGAESAHVRFVGLSATLPNYEDVAALLQVNRTNGLFHFDSSFREVPLHQTYCQAMRVKGINSAEVLNSIAYDKTMQHAATEQVMIFVHSRKDTEFTARFILQKAEFENKAESVMRAGSDSLNAVREAIADVEAHGGSIRDQLRLLLLKGFATHHAGMTREERSLVETLFLNRHIRILVCTSTLAWGVNLPANVVIIKGTRVFSAEKGNMDLLSVLDVLQMFGRAGRVGFGSSLGRACIITSSAEDLQYYLTAVTEQLPIESQFVKRLVDSMNAEVVLGSIRSIHDAVHWLRQTYFFVRMKKNPQLYGARPTAKDPECLQHLHNLVHTAALHLSGCKLVEYDQDRRLLRPTELGRIASHYYVTYESMKVYTQNMWEGMHEVDLFRLFALSHEFAHVSVRPDETVQLQEMLAACPIAVKESKYTTEAKINVLLQCYISNMALSGPLMSELVYVKDSAQRIMRALYDIALERKFGKTARKVMHMYLMVLRRQWIVQSPLRQLKDQLASQFYSTVIDALESRRLDWPTIQSLQLEDMQEILKRDRHAEVAVDAVAQIPAFSAVAVARPLSRHLVYIDVDITPTFRFVEELHKTSTRELLLTIEHTNGTILHSETVSLPLHALQRAERDGSGGVGLQATIAVPLADPKPCFYFLRLMSAHWIGCEVCTPIDLMNVHLPREPKAPVEYLEDGADDNEDALAVASVMRQYHLADVASQIFEEIPAFTKLQCNVIRHMFTSDADHAPDMFVGVPAGHGKTVLAELYILRFLRDRTTSRHDGGALLYVTAHPDVASRRFAEWEKKFELLGANVAHLTTLIGYSGAEAVATALKGVSIIIACAESILPLLRRGGDELFSVTHLVVDHAHLLRDSGFKAFESVVARLTSAPYLLYSGARRPHILTLSLPLRNYDDVCEWLKIPTAINYGKSFRTGELSTICGCDAPGYHNRFEQCKLSIKRLLEDENSVVGRGCTVVFVPSSKEAIQLCREHLNFVQRVKGDSARIDIHEKLRSMLGGDDNEDDDVLFEDAFLGKCVETGGVGFLTRRTSDCDVGLLLYLSRNAGPITVFATFDSAWRLPAVAFDTSIVALNERRVAAAKDTEELSAQLWTDCSISEVLQMTSRGHRPFVYCRKSSRWAMHQFVNELLPLESCNRDALDFCEAVNAAVAQGYARDMKQLLKVLRTHYVYYHCKSNPSFYGIGHDASDRARLLSQIAGGAVMALEEVQCAVQDKTTYSVRATALGVSLAHHCTTLATLESFRSGAEATMASVLYTICGSEEFTTIGDLQEFGRVRRDEAALLQIAARSLRQSFGVNYLQLDYAKVRTKIFLLVLARCARWRWSELHVHIPDISKEFMTSYVEVGHEMEHDTSHIVPVVLRLLGCAVELLPRSSWTCVQIAQRLSQLVSTSTWCDEADTAAVPLLQRYPDIVEAINATVQPSDRSLRSLRNSFAKEASQGALTSTIKRCAERWRPQMHSDEDVAKKEAILRKVFESVWSAPDITQQLKVASEVVEASEGHFVCVVTVATHLELPRGATLEQSLWTTCVNAAPGYEKVFAMRKDTCPVQPIDESSDGADTAAAPLFPKRVQVEHSSRLIFPVEDIEDIEKLQLEVHVALCNARVTGVRAVDDQPAGE